MTRKPTILFALMLLTFFVLPPAAVNANDMDANDPPIISCSVSSGSVNAGQTVVFNSIVTWSYGNAPVYSWTGDCTGSSANCVTSFAASGTKTAGLRVTGTNGLSSTASCSVNVINVVCSTNAQCGTSGLVGSPFCQGNGVYQNYKTYTCNNPGTASSSCTDSTTAQLQTTCTGNQTCQNAQCANNCTIHTSKQCSGSAVYWYDSCGAKQDLFQQCTSSQICQNAQCINIACNSNADCGSQDGFIGSPYCQGNSVYQTYRTYTCSNPGTANSSCVLSDASQKKNDCTTNQTCTNGSCTNYNNLSVTCTANPSSIQTGQSSTFTATASGGSGNYTYIWSGACTGTAQTCTNTYSAQGTQTAAVTVASGTQSASNSCYVSVNQNCTSNYQQRCVGNSMYWYDSCGNQQGYVGTCGTYNTCTQNAYERCSGNYLYWYDSCGNQQGMAQYCPNGCYNNYCQNYTPVVYNNASLTAAKTVRNITTGSGWSSSTYASPGDMLMFMLTLQASGQNAQNVFIRDSLPSNFIYQNQLTVAGTNNYYNNYSGDITSGINLNTISNGQTVTVTYQAQVASAANFSYGTTTLNNSAYVTSSNATSPTASATVVVTRAGVLGASTVSTGLTNNFWVDSFFLPLIITLIGIWMLRSGMFFGIEKWLDNRKKIHRGYKSEKELSARIQEIQKSGKI